MSKEIQLFFYSDSHLDAAVTDAMPVLSENGTGLRPADESATNNICAEGLALFGLKKPPAKGEIVRVTLEVKATELATYEVKADFKPLAPAKARRK